MNIEKMIENWQSKNLINKTQATEMLKQINEEKKAASSSKLITIVSTIGAILLGASALLFISANWNQMPSLMKSAILVGSTFAAYITGYYLRYERKNLPRLGGALLFLGGILFGATIFLEAQIYNINADSHILLLIWLGGLLPIAYATKFTPLAFISTIVFYFWVFFFMGNQIDMFDFPYMLIPVLLVLISMLLFSIGALHYLKPDLKYFAKTYRYIGIVVGMFALYTLTFEEMSRSLINTNIQASIGLAVVAIPTIILSLVNIFYNPQKTKTFELEGAIVLGLTLLLLVNYVFPGYTPYIYNQGGMLEIKQPFTIIYPILYNIITIGIISTLIYIGNKRQNLRLIDMGMFYLTIYLILKYSDWFWNRMEKSLFFFIGGAILITLSIFLERKRRELKDEFTK